MKNQRYLNSKLILVTALVMLTSLAQASYDCDFVCINLNKFAAPTQYGRLIFSQGRALGYGQSDSEAFKDAMSNCKSFNDTSGDGNPFFLVKDPQILYANGFQYLYSGADARPIDCRKNRE